VAKTPTLNAIRTERGAEKERKKGITQLAGEKKEGKERGEQLPTTITTAPHVHFPGYGKGKREKGREKIDQKTTGEGGKGVIQRAVVFPPIYWLGEKKREGSSQKGGEENDVRFASFFYNSSECGIRKEEGSENIER